jgi:DNA-binding transcriptional LysR family regulator
VAGNYSSNSGAALYDALLQGAGIAKVLEYAAADDLAAGRLQAIFADTARAKRFVLGYYPRTTVVPARVQLFLDFLTSYLDRKLGGTGEPRQRAGQIPPGE